MTVGKARELLDTPAGREVLIDAVKEAVAKGEIPASLEKEELLFAEGIATVEDEKESLEGSEKPGVGSSEPLTKSTESTKVESLDVADFTCSVCKEIYRIVHVARGRHRLILQKVT
jgi:hypothetical protein